jgi:hypothetical protein
MSFRSYSDYLKNRKNISNFIRTTTNIEDLSNIVTNVENDLSFNFTEIINNSNLISSFDISINNFIIDISSQKQTIQNSNTILNDLLLKSTANTMELTNADTILQTANTSITTNKNQLDTLNNNINNLINDINNNKNEIYVNYTDLCNNYTVYNNDISNIITDTINIANNKINIETNTSNIETNTQNLTILNNELQTIENSIEPILSDLSVNVNIIEEQNNQIFALEESIINNRTLIIDNSSNISEHFIYFAYNENDININTTTSLISDISFTGGEIFAPSDLSMSDIVNHSLVTDSHIFQVLQEGIYKLNFESSITRISGSSNLKSSIYLNNVEIEESISYTRIDGQTQINDIISSCIINISNNDELKFVIEKTNNSTAQYTIFGNSIRCIIEKI